MRITELISSLKCEHKNPEKKKEKRDPTIKPRFRIKSKLNLRKLVQEVLMGFRWQERSIESSGKSREAG